MTRNSLTSLGISILAVLLAIAVFAPWLSRYDPNGTDPASILQSPSMTHLFGTDNWGRDIMARVFYAASIDLSLAVFTVIVAALGGAAMGAIIGYYGGRLDEIGMRITDVFLSFPSFLLGMALMVALGPGYLNLALTQTFIRVPIFGRAIRGEMMSVKQNEYAEAARCAGDSNTRIVFYHLLPNCITPLIVLATLNFGYAILEIASLSFLGLGIQPPTSEWGLMVSLGAEYVITGQWWVSFFPGLFIILAVLAFNLVGDGIRDLLERRVR